MKKILSIIFVLIIMFTSVSFADKITAESLGYPTALIKDTSIIGKYPAALQMFPNAVWAKISGGSYTLGFAYLYSDLAGEAALYTKSADSFTISVPVSSVYSGLISSSINSTNHVMLLSYGGKLGNLYGGVYMQDIFPTDTILNQTIDSNGLIESSETFEGLKSTLNPSVILDMDTIKIFAALPITLNMMKYYGYSDYKTNSVTITPNLINSIGVDAMATYQLKKSLVALSVSVKAEDTGYKVETITNSVQEYKTNKLANMYEFSASLGTMTKANDKLTLFFDIPIGLSINVASHWEGILNSAYNVNYVYTLPVLKFGTEIQVLKFLKFRASASPSWTRKVTVPAGYNSNNNNVKTVTDKYGISTSLGAGLKLGKFYINGIVDASTFIDAFTAPATLVGGIISTIAPANFFTSVQVNYVF